MGVGGSFWDLLKPYARHEGAGYLRSRRVAVDLSFWVVSHSTAIRARSPRARCPHLRTTLFRTLSLFSEMGAFPVFVVDGEPSPLKAQELLEYLGMPVLRADGEAEALCARLNNEGHVDACTTSDSDAFLFGAKTVIKVLRSNCRADQTVGNLLNATP